MMKKYIFDFDGTLVDSMKHWSQKMIHILEKRNIDYESDIVKIITPLGDRGTAQYFIENFGMNESEEELIREMDDYAMPKYHYEIQEKESVKETLAELKKRGCSLNVLTASPHKMLDACLKRLEIYELFDNVWSCDDFKTTKSDVHIYKMAAEKLQTTTADCIFCDDNINALFTAKQAGMEVIGVYDESSAEDKESIKNLCSKYVYTFSELLEKQEYFPDGTPIGHWFYDINIPALEALGKQYVLTDYGVSEDGHIYTKKIQELIDIAAESGGGVIVVPKGIYMTGSLYFKQGVHLYVSEGGVLKGSDDISDYDIKMTRMEGETCLYYTALINADGVDGFVMCGSGTIDGNGIRAWKAFWNRRIWNPQCTNKEEQRPRLVYISNSRNVWITGLNLINSHFWTTHIYKCNYVKYLGCKFFSPVSPVKAPSTDAIDIDGCSDVLIKNCRMEVNDDAVVLKGGKGPWADKAGENGSNERIIIEDCTYGFCHGCLTCGSESVHNRNIIMRKIKVEGARNLLWLKMRPDTPQKYEYILLEDIQGKVFCCVDINPWTQFFDLKDRKDIPLSYAEYITIKNCCIECDNFFAVKAEERQYHLSDFVLENLEIVAENTEFNSEAIDNMIIKDVRVREHYV